MPTLPLSLVKSIKVRTLHLGHKKKLNAVLTTSARNTFFDCAELGGKVSVEQYFAKSKYKSVLNKSLKVVLTEFLEYPRFKLKYAVDLPVVDLGTKKKSVFVPAELCVIEEGVAYHAKLSDKETAQMIRYACNPPKVNADAIVDRGFPALGFTNPVDSPIVGFNITIDPNMAVVPGRELRPPGLTYKVGQAKVQNGSWNILDVKFHRPATVHAWWVMVVRDGRNMIAGPNDARLRGLVTGFGDKLRACGLSLPNALPKLLPPPNLPPKDKDPDRLNAINTIREVLKQAIADARGQKPSFILVLLENRDNYIYPGIKVSIIPNLTLFFYQFKPIFL